MEKQARNFVVLKGLPGGMWHLASHSFWGKGTLCNLSPPNHSTFPVPLSAPHSHMLVQLPWSSPIFSSFAAISAKTKGHLKYFIHGVLGAQPSQETRLQAGDMVYCPERWKLKQIDSYKFIFFLCRHAEEFSSSSDQKRKPQTPTLVILFTQGGTQEFWFTPKCLWLPCTTTNLLRVELTHNPTKDTTASFNSNSYCSP